MQASAQTAQAPQIKLLLGIVVEGLDDGSLEMLRESFGEGGFRYLYRNGVYLPQADFGTQLDATSATALLVSGAQPALNGVDAESHFDRDRLLPVHVYADKDAMGNFTTAAYSPSALKVSTITDELLIAGAGINSAYSVAVEPGAAIALAGHSGNVALWLDKATGNWASSTYYRDMPAAIAGRNRTRPLVARLDTASWAPLEDPGKYVGLPEHLSRYAFRYVFPRSDSRRIEKFAASPLANSEVTAVATELLNASRVGSAEEGIDALQLGYSLVTYPYGRSADRRLEQQDAYLRLARSIEQLFNAIDRTVGLDHTLIYLAGTPAPPQTPRDDPKWRVPAGEFSTRRAASLLNIYLMAIHGNGDYVAGFHGGRLYLNQRLLKERNLDIEAVSSDAAAFLRRMTGVDRAYTAGDIAAGRAGENAMSLRRNTFMPTAPEVTLVVAPGFEIVDDFESPGTGADTPRYTRRAGSSAAPFFIVAPQLEARRIDVPADARAIAPTVARVLRIRSPNGAETMPISLR